MTNMQTQAMSRTGETGEIIFRDSSACSMGGEAKRYEVAALIKERDGWQEHAKWLQRHLHLTQCDNTLLRAQAKGDVWVWQGDGTDHLESMGNRMVVAIFARDLRTAIANATNEPCTVCGNAEAQHGSYPTCASHPYTPDENCRHVIGARCLGAECNSKGCVRGVKAAIAAATEGAV